MSILDICFVPQPFGTISSANTQTVQDAHVSVGASRSSLSSRKQQRLNQAVMILVVNETFSNNKSTCRQACTPPSGHVSILPSTWVNKLIQDKLKKIIGIWRCIHPTHFWAKIVDGIHLGIWYPFMFLPYRQLIGHCHMCAHRFFFVTNGSIPDITGCTLVEPSLDDFPSASSAFPKFQQSFTYIPRYDRGVVSDKNSKCRETVGGLPNWSPEFAKNVFPKIQGTYCQNTFYEMNVSQKRNGFGVQNQTQNEIGTYRWMTI